MLRDATALNERPAGSGSRRRWSPRLLRLPAEVVGPSHRLPRILLIPADDVIG